MLSFALLVAACGGGGGSTDITGTLVFADRSDAEISRIINAAGGGEMFGAQAQVDSFSGPAGDPCPGVTVEGSDTIVLAGGCTTQQGVAIGGGARITNPLGWDQVEPEFGSDTVYEFDQLTLTQGQAPGTVTQSFDGFMRIEDSYTTYDADLTVTTLDVAVRSDIHYECSQSDRTCSLSGSGIELVGVGGALVSGSVQTASASASFTLRGADTLTAKLMNGCIAWNIEGTDRSKTCP